MEHISTQDLFAAYAYWCGENGIKRRLSKREFLRSLREGLEGLNIPFTEPHSGELRYFEGICLTWQPRRNLDDFYEDDLYELDDFKDEDDDELEDEE